MRNPAGLLSGRTRRREQAHVADLRTPPGGQPRYAGGLLTADAEDGRQHPPGSLTPEACRQLEEELRTGIERHAVTVPAGRVSGPQPTFTPHAAPRPTTEIPILGGLPGTAPGAAREYPLNAPAFARGRLRDEPRPATFAADRQELPFFAALTAEAGWQGLHARFIPPAHEYWTTDRWALHAMAEVERAAEAAFNDVDAGIRAAYDRVFGSQNSGGAR